MGAQLFVHKLLWHKLQGKGVLGHGSAAHVPVARLFRHILQGKAIVAQGKHAHCL